MTKEICIVIEDDDKTFLAEELEKLEDELAGVCADYGLTGYVENGLTGNTTRIEKFRKQFVCIDEDMFIDWFLQDRINSLYHAYQALTGKSVSLREMYHTLSDLFCDLRYLPRHLILNWDELDLPDQCLEDGEISEENIEHWMWRWEIEWV